MYLACVCMRLHTISIGWALLGCWVMVVVWQGVDGRLWRVRRLQAAQLCIIAVTWAHYMGAGQCRSSDGRGLSRLLVAKHAVLNDDRPCINILLKALQSGLAFWPCWPACASASIDVFR